MIRSGRIVRERDDRDGAPVAIPPHLLEHARRAHEECLAALLVSPALSRAGA